VTRFGHIGGTNVSLGQFTARGMQHRYRLIHMGARHDSVVATDEKTGTTGSTDQIATEGQPCSKKLQGELTFRLDWRPANGCRLFS